MRLRAVDPVIATLILVIVAVVSGVVAYSFVSDFIAQNTSQTQNPSKFVIDAAVLYDDGTSDLYVRNLSDETIYITTVMVLDGGDLHLINQDTFSPPLQVPPHGIRSIAALPVAAGVTPGQWYVIKVVSSDGSSAAIKVKCQLP